MIEYAGPMTVPASKPLALPCQAVACDWFPTKEYPPPQTVPAGSAPRPITVVYDPRWRTVDQRRPSKNMTVAAHWKMSVVQFAET